MQPAHRLAVAFASSPWSAPFDPSVLGLEIGAELDQEVEDVVPLAAMARWSAVCPCSKRDMRRRSVCGFSATTLRMRSRSPTADRRDDVMTSRRVEQQRDRLVASGVSCADRRRVVKERSPTDDVEGVHVAEAMDVATRVEQRSHDRGGPPPRPSAAGRYCLQIRVRSGRPLPPRAASRHRADRASPRRIVASYATSAPEPATNDPTSKRPDRHHGALLSGTMFAVKSLQRRDR